MNDRKDFLLRRTKGKQLVVDYENYLNQCHLKKDVNGLLSLEETDIIMAQKEEGARKSHVFTKLYEKRAKYIGNEIVNFFNGRASKEVDAPFYFFCYYSEFCGAMKVEVGEVLSKWADLTINDPDGLISFSSFDFKSILYLSYSEEWDDTEPLFDIEIKFR